MATEPRIVSGVIIPPEPHDIGMPRGTPLGLGILGAARFAAIRRVFEHAERAARAKAGYHHGRAAEANGIVAQEAAFEQLNHLDTLRKHTADRIRFAYEEQRRLHAAAVRAEQAAIEADDIAQLRRKFDRMEVEENIRLRQERLTKDRGGAREATSAASPSDDDGLASWLGRVPDFVKKAEAAKAEIMRDAGGEERLTEGQRAICDTIDDIVQAVLSKQVEKAAL